MDDKRKRYVAAGILVGVITVGLVMLARRTPRDQWKPTLLKIARDVVTFLKLVPNRYASSDLIAASEKILDRLSAAVDDDSAPGNLPKAA